jgi:hypothetical protein
MDPVKALVFPSGTYHLCLNDFHLVIEGHETLLHIKYSNKKAWEIQELYETCYYAKHYFEENMEACPLSRIKDQPFYARYQNYGCYIASNINSPLLTTFKTYLGQQNDFSKTSLITSLITYDGNTQVWPPTVKGNDMILDRSDNGNSDKRGWSNYEREDSCYHIREHFKEKSNIECNVDELTPYPVRSYGECFVSMNSNKTRVAITDKLQSILSGKCKGSDKGIYYDPVEDMNSRAVIDIIGIPSIILMFIVTILNV